MNSNICEKCGQEILSNFTVCPNCGNNLISKEMNIDNEIDAIIDSVVDDVLDNNNSKIINMNNEKKLKIDNLNSIIYRIEEKCINCGQCKKICENKANISYDLNKCKKPICIDCGQCVLNCPSEALYIKEDYKEVKEILDANEKVVVAVISPEIKLLIKDMFLDEKIESKFIEGLKKLGFDYIFDGSLGCEIYTTEVVRQLIDIINKRGELPLISSSCPSWIKYAEIYHPELLKNISTCKNPLVLQCEAIKQYFSKEKGFELNKIITVGISTCLSKKMKSKEYNYGIDYVLSEKEIFKLLDEYEIKMDILNGKDYDNLTLESGFESPLFSFLSGESYSIINKLYTRLTNSILDNKNILNEVELDNNIKEIKVQVAGYEIRFLVISQMKNLEKILKNINYKNYHYIEIMNCNDGCIGSRLELSTSKIKNNVFDIINSKAKANLNERLKELYQAIAIDPYSAKSREIFHTNYSNKSNLLNNK